MKTCKKRKEIKELVDFPVRKDTLSGLRATCRNCTSEIHKIYHEINKEKHNTNNKEYAKVNRKAISAVEKERLKTDPLFKLTKKLRTMITGAFSRHKKNKKCKSIDYLGIGFDELQDYLLQTAYKNYGLGIFDNTVKFHIDHIKPLRTAKTEDSLIALQHYTNLQYLTKTDNLTKNGKLNWSLDQL